MAVNNKDVNLKMPLVASYWSHCLHAINASDGPGMHDGWKLMNKQYNILRSVICMYMCIVYHNWFSP